MQKETLTKTLGREPTESEEKFAATNPHYRIAALEEDMKLIKQMLQQLLDKQVIK